MGSISKIIYNLTLLTVLIKCIYATIVEEIGKKTNTELKVFETNKNNFFYSKKNIILAKLDTLDMRKNLIKNVKSMKLATNKIYNNWSAEKVFVNECLIKSKCISIDIY